MTTWVQGQTESAKVTLYITGQIKLNRAAQVAIGGGAIGVFYNSAENRLGFRRGTSEDCVGVLFNEDMAYSMDGSALLENLGVSIAEEVTLDLQSPAPPSPTTLGDEGIYWVTLPE